ncbi:putative lipoprotein YiaD precursor [Mariprofundus micogutta]|uniref:Putative lipoprotein YiaD n=1 Tax=Mariprofundus micogutta TaxID=1921010 RepID=A0A1L8CMR9_9PROT|nr:OmpA family protein [Mariprofundus micogutta]GAV20196.1 putative lipoprotein YiaD precursor [Mariprofundus micogutta]
MVKPRYLLLVMLLTLSSCSTIEAIFGISDEPAVQDDSRLAAENQQLGTEIADLRQELSVLEGDIADQKSQEVARLEAEEKARLQAEQAIPKDRLWVTVSFRSGYMELTKASRRALKRLAEKFVSKPRTQTLDVRGYTDDEPIGGYAHSRHTPRHPYKTNLALSKARADSVAATMISAGVPHNIVHAEGFGATHFVADNKTASGRERNRRAEVHLVNK